LPLSQLAYLDRERFLFAVAQYPHRYPLTDRCLGDQITILLVLVLLPTLAGAVAYHGRIVGVVTQKPLAGAFVTLHHGVVQRDDNVARIVTFKDNPLAVTQPDLAVKTRNGSIWRDRERLAWTDPFKQEVRDYQRSDSSLRSE
jgi:hypothetical protein